MKRNSSSKNALIAPRCWVNTTVGLIALGVIAPLIARCHTSQPTTTPTTRLVASTFKPRRSDVTVRSFSETTPYTSLAVFGQHIYAGTSNGVIRFDRRSHEFVRIAKDEGLAGDYVYGLSADSQSGLWVATDGGISRYYNGVWSNQPNAMASFQSITTVIAAPEGLWVGGTRGLGLLSGSQWSSSLPGATVTHLLRDPVRKGVWVGTAGEGVYRLDQGKFVSQASNVGQRIRTVDSMTTTMEGGLLVVGKGATHDEIAFFDGTHWTALELAPQGDVKWVTQVGGQIFFAYNDRILKLQRFDMTQFNPKADNRPVGPVRISAHRSPTAPQHYPVPYFYTEEVDLNLPADPTVIVGSGTDVLIGTKTLGVLHIDAQQLLTWYRTNDLVGAHAEKLKLACVSDEECFIAGGQGNAYRFTPDQRFELISVSPDSTTKVHAFVKNLLGEVMALHSSQGSKTLQLSILKGATFSLQKEIPLNVPSKEWGIRFARFSPRGELWVGLVYRDTQGETRPWGIGVITPHTDVVYHRTSLLPTEDRSSGSLALPDDIRDVFFGSEAIWIATGVGICKLQGTQVNLFTENDGLESEIAYAVNQDANRHILAATYGGLGVFNGQKWTFDSVGDIDEVTARGVAVLYGAVWVGTNRGILPWNQKQVLPLTQRDGLADDDVLDLDVSRPGQIWALSRYGVSIVDVKASAR